MAIQSPVLGLPPGSRLIPVTRGEGFFRARLSQALDQFECQDGIHIKVPLLDKGWENLRRVSLGPSKVSGLIQTARLFLSFQSDVERHALSQPLLDETALESGSHWYLQLQNNQAVDSRGIFL